VLRIAVLAFVVSLAAPARSGSIWQNLTSDNTPEEWIVRREGLVPVVWGPYPDPLAPCPLREPGPLLIDPVARVIEVGPASYAPVSPGTTRYCLPWVGSSWQGVQIGLGGIEAGEWTLRAFGSELTFSAPEPTGPIAGAVLSALLAAHMRQRRARSRA
jgi:hypothetical protein